MPLTFRVMGAAGSRRAEITIYDFIGRDWWTGEGFTAKDLKDHLDSAGDISGIDVYLNSPGGDVFEGVAIYNQLNRHQAKVTVHIDGWAASIASVIAMAGDEIRIAENAFVMIHDPWTCVCGGALAMREAADTLDRIRDNILETYVARTGGDEATIRQQMAAETWLTGAEAVAAGFADVLIENKRVAASAHAGLQKAFRNAPAISHPEPDPAPSKAVSRPRVTLSALDRLLRSQASTLAARRR